MQGSGPLAPGTRFAGEYTILRPLAEGGMGEVYVARQDSTGRERALKVMHPWLVEDPASRLRFEREARVGARIESAHVVDVVGAGIDEPTGLPWIAMELLSGETLYEYLKARGSLPLAEARDLLAQIAHGLGAAHRQHLVHRDLKPDNVMVADTHREGAGRTIKLLDFGIAKLVQERRTGVAATSAVGSPLWMAPEQTHETVDITPRTDVFAFGLLAFWLLTGRIYWLQADGSVPVMLRQLHVDDLEPATRRAAAFGVADRLPAGFDAWFAKAVAREPADRFEDATAAMAALDAVLARAELGTAGTMAMPAPVVAKPPPVSPRPTTPRGGSASPSVRTAPLPVAAPPVAAPSAPRPAWSPAPATPVLAPSRPPRRISPFLIGLLLVAVMTFGAAVGFLGWVLATRDEPRPAPRPRVPTSVPQAPDFGPPLVPLPDVPLRPGQAWTGTYLCRQATTPMTLEIRGVDGLHVQGIFRFTHPLGVGSYHVSGTYEASGRRLQLTPGAWIQRPSDFIAVGMDGTIDPAGQRYAGRMQHPDCTTFQLHL